MFREQLHTAFDNISPSPELLDKVSAMMSEEAGKKKAPLRLNVVKYGGIAAALVLAAGGTILVLNDQNRDIKTSNASDMAIREEATENAAAEGIRAADNAYSAQPTEAYYTASEIIADEDAIPTNTSPAVVQRENAAEETGSMGIMPFGTTAAVAEVPADNGLSGAGVEGAEYDRSEIEKEAADEKPAGAQAAAVPTIDGVESDNAVVYDNAVADGVSEAEMPTDNAENPLTGLMATDPFLQGYSYSLYAIPDQLKDLVDGVRIVSDDGDVIYGEKWKEYIAAVYPGADLVTGIEDDLNIYTFIKYFNVPVEDARTALYNAADTGKGHFAGITLTREEADVILTMDVKRLTETFATREAIVKGTKIYTPVWLLKHEFEEYEAAGITKDDILAKYDLLTTMADRYSDAVIGEEIQAELTAKLDGFVGFDVLGPDGAALSTGSPELNAAVNEVLLKAADINKIYNTFFGFDRDFEHEDLTDEQITALGLDPHRMYFKVTDARFDTWEELTAAWSGYFSENAVQFLLKNAPTQYFVQDGEVYALYVDGGALDVDKMEPAAIIPAGDDRLTIDFDCYFEDELAPGSYRQSDTVISAEFVKTADGWVLDSSDGWRDNWEWLFGCRNFILE